MPEERKAKSEVLAEALGQLERAAACLETGLADRSLLDRLHSVASSEGDRLSWLVVPLDARSREATLRWLLANGTELVENLSLSPDPLTVVEVANPDADISGNEVRGRGIFGPGTLLIARDCAAVVESGRILNKVMEHAPVWLVAGMPDSAPGEALTEMTQTLSGSTATLPLPVVFGVEQASWPGQVNSTPFQVNIEGEGFALPSVRNFPDIQRSRELRKKKLVQQLANVIDSEWRRRYDRAEQRFQQGKRDAEYHKVAEEQCNTEEKKRGQEIAARVQAWQAKTLAIFKGGLGPELAEVAEVGTTKESAPVEGVFPLDRKDLLLPAVELKDRITELARRWVRNQGERDQALLVEAAQRLSTMTRELGLAGGATIGSDQLGIDNYLDNFERHRDVVVELRSLVDRVAEWDTLSVSDFLMDRYLVVLLPSIASVAGGIVLVSQRPELDFGQKLLSLAGLASVVSLGIWQFVRRKRPKELQKRERELGRLLRALADRLRDVRQRMANDSITALADRCREEAKRAVARDLALRSEDHRRMAAAAVSRTSSAQAELEQLRKAGAMVAEARRILAEGRA